MHVFKCIYLINKIYNLDHNTLQLMGNTKLYPSIVASLCIIQGKSVLEKLSCCIQDDNYDNTTCYKGQME